MRPDSAVGVRRADLSAMALAAGAGLLLYCAVNYVYVAFVADVFGSPLVAGRDGAVETARGLTLLLLASAGVGAYCSARPGAGAFVLACQLVFVVIPMQALVRAGYAYADPTFATVVGASLLVATITAALLPVLRVNQRRAWAIAAIVVLSLIGLYTYAALIGTSGLQRLNFDLAKVYDFRADFEAGGAFPLSGYVISWQGYVINPALLAIAMQRRNWLLAALALVLQLALFGMTNFRSFLFMPVLLAFCAWVGPKRAMPALLIGGSLGVIACGSIFYVVTGDTLLPGILVDRTVIIPAEVHGWYYDYFHTQGHAFLLLTQSVLAPLGGPVPQPIAATIGLAYLGPNSSANVGLFGDAFANFGIPGCVIFAVLAGLLIRVIESFSVGSSAALTTSLVGPSALELVNAGLLTTFATHGLAVLLVVLWVLHAFGRRGDEATA